jgi:hypothetical protein
MSLLSAGSISLDSTFNTKFKFNLLKDKLSVKIILSICKSHVYVSSGSNNNNNNNNNNNGRSSLGSCECKAGLIAAYNGQGELILCSVARLEALVQDLELTTIPPTEGRQTHLTNQF